MQTVLPISHASLLSDGPDLVDNICVDERLNLVSFDLLVGCIFCYSKAYTDSPGQMQISTSTCSDCRQRTVISK